MAEWNSVDSKDTSGTESNASRDGSGGGNDDPALSRSQSQSPSQTQSHAGRSSRLDGSASTNAVHVQFEGDQVRRHGWGRGGKDTDKHVT